MPNTLLAAGPARSMSATPIFTEVGVTPLTESDAAAQSVPVEAPAGAEACASPGPTDEESGAFDPPTTTLPGWPPPGVVAVLVAPVEVEPGEADRLEVAPDCCCPGLDGANPAAVDCVVALGTTAQPSTASTSAVARAAAARSLRG